MAGDTRVVLNIDGGRAILNSPEVAAMIEARVAAIAAAAGEGMEHSTKAGRDRIRGTVWTGTYAAKQAEATDRALTRALDAGR